MTKFILGLILVLSLVFVVWSSDRSASVRGEQPVKSEGTLMLPISTVIVPHHLLAKDDISHTLQEVSEAVGGDTIERVILLSPNHFDVGRTWIIGSAKTWDTPAGALVADSMFLDTIRNRDTTFGQAILEREHGIRDLLPFVKHYFPHATLVPLALRDGIPNTTVDRLAESLSAGSEHTRTLLIVSADFSHYLDWNFSRFHDNRAILALSGFHLEQIEKLDVDCIGCLRVALQYAKSAKTEHFHLVARSSSLEVAGENVIGEETSHVAGYFSQEAPDVESASSQSVDLLFSGSIRPEEMTENARRIYMSQDANIFMLDGDITLSRESYLPHQQGIIASGEKIFEPGETYSVREIRGRKMAFVELSSQYSRDTVLAAVAQAKQEVDYTVVYWRTAIPNQVEWIDMSHALADSGADLIIGNQNLGAPSLEMYHDHVILSSLEDTPLCGTTRTCPALMVGVSLQSSQLQYFLMPVKREKSVSLATEPLRSDFLRRLSGTSSDRMVRSMIEQGFFALEKR